MLLKPDFILFDIEMPFLNGFDLLSKFEKLFFEVIFTTAYDATYAIKAKDFIQFCNHQKTHQGIVNVPIPRSEFYNNFLEKSPG